MAYTKQTWDTTSYVNPTRMNHIETGIANALTNENNGILGAKNLIQSMKSRDHNGITYVYDQRTGGVTISGTATSTSYQDSPLSSVYSDYPIFKAGTYIVSGRSNSNDWFLNVYKYSTTGQALGYIDLKTEYYDLGLEYRNETNDQVTVDSANATLKYGVAVKCATITPNAARMTEYTLKEMWKSPNGTIRAILDGTVFRTPIVVKGIEPCVKNWEKPITLARHAYGDVYKNAEIKIPGAGKAEIVFTAEDGTEVRELIHNFKGAGIIQGMHNTEESISSFAKACFNFAIDTKQDLWFATKDTISKKYDHTFKDIFQEIYDAEYKDKFEELGV